MFYLRKVGLKAVHVFCSAKIQEKFFPSLQETSRLEPTQVEKSKAKSLRTSRDYVQSINTKLLAIFK